MRRSFTLSIATLALTAGLAIAEPEISVTYRSGVPVIQIAGNYAGSTYTVYRAVAGGDYFGAITAFQTLCTGDCFAVDYDALPGETYLYRFDLSLQDGRLVSFGPYPVTISPEQARRMGIAVYPNPGRGATRVRITLAGSPSDAPVEAEAALFDLHGRALRTLHRGLLARGVSTFEWDGRGGDGREIGPGLYFLRLKSGAGIQHARVIRRR